jgi:hypothetical protein
MYNSGSFAEVTQVRRSQNQMICPPRILCPFPRVVQLPFSILGLVMSSGQAKSLYSG